MQHRSEECGEPSTDQAPPHKLLVQDDYALVSTSSPDASYFTHASVVDNISGDPVFVSAVRVE